MRILLVDDDPMILDTARDILEDAGYTVDSAATASEALLALGKNKADVMLVDFNLPDSTGVALAVTARRLQPKLRVLLMTGEGSIKLEPGAPIDDYLIKPVNPAKLLELLKKIS